MFALSRWRFGHTSPFFFQRLHDSRLLCINDLSLLSFRVRRE